MEVKLLAQDTLPLSSHIERAIRNLEKQKAEDADPSLQDRLSKLNARLKFVRRLQQKTCRSPAEVTLSAEELDTLQVGLDLLL